MKRVFLFILLYTLLYITLMLFGVVHLTLFSLWLIPIGILISSLAMSSGIAGAAFWFPVFLVFHLDPKLASWIALCAMFFGFGSGLIKHYRQGTMSWDIIQRYLYTAILGGMIGSILFGQIDPYWIIVIFGIFLILYGGKMFLSPPQPQTHTLWISQTLALVGGILKGLVSIGIEIIITDSLNSKQDHEKIVGSVVVVVFVVNLFVLITRLLVDHDLVFMLQRDGASILDMMLLIIPSVIIGGQLGPLIVKKMSRETLIRYVSILLIIVGSLVLLKVNG
jgi:uncharacterized membrane protein YfcA